MSGLLLLVTDTGRSNSLDPMSDALALNLVDNQNNNAAPSPKQIHHSNNNFSISYLQQKVLLGQEMVTAHQSEVFEEVLVMGQVLVFLRWVLEEL